MKKIVNILALMVLVASVATAQQRGNRAESDTLKNLPVIHASYGAFLPGGDLAKRFGWNSELSLAVWYKKKNNWIFAIEGSLIFGDVLRGDTNILDGMINSDNAIIGDDGQYVSYHLYERGYKLPVFKIGKMIPAQISKSNTNSGFFGLVGVGFMQHKIRIYDQSKTFAQIKEGYAKGYDRLTNGLMLTQNFGYMYLGRGNMVNFKVSFEFSQAFTRNRRSYNFDTKSGNSEDRLDLLYGIKLGWSIPLYKKMAEGYYYR